LRPANTKTIDPDLPLVPRRRKVGWLPVSSAAAAAIAIGFLSLTRAPTQYFSDSTTTAVGVIGKMNLPDGSLIELNSEAALSVAFTPTERRVHLQRGEAHFSVAKNAARPFIVEVSGVAVRAVGTAFNVRLGAGTVEVLVTEGKVRVDDSKGSSLLALPPDSASPVLNAGEQVIVPSAPARQVPAAIVRVDSAGVSRLLAWQEKTLVFDPTPPREIVAQFNRTNRHKLVIDDGTISNLRVGGSFKASDPDTFVRLLEANFGIAADRGQDRTVLRARR
jgi:transmembrane sensor